MTFLIWSYDIQLHIELVADNLGEPPTLNSPGVGLNVKNIYCNKLRILFLSRGSIIFKKRQSAAT
jgi:hypothetical protein